MSRAPCPVYFMSIAEMISKRSTCLRRQVGAVAVRDKQILASGYNGAPSGLPHCLDVGCIRLKENIPSGERHELCRAVHAEQNVIIQATLHGVSLLQSDFYVTTQPCILCAKMLINCGVRSVYFGERYPDTMALDLLKEAKIPVFCLSDNKKA